MNVKNLKVIFKNPKARSVFLITVFIVGLVTVLSFLSLRKKSNEHGAQVVVSNVKRMGSANATLSERSPYYLDMQKKLNDINYADAKKAEKSTLPIDLSVPESKKSKQDPYLNTEEVSPIAPKDNATRTIAPPTSNKNDKNNPVVNEIKNLMSSWARDGSQFNQIYTIGSVNAKNQPSKVSDESKKTVDKNTTTLSTTGKPSSGPQTSNPLIMRAGDMLVGVLDTAVNSDEPGPVLATIVDGQLKGSKLLGMLQQMPPVTGTNGPTKLILQFSRLTPMDADRSVPTKIFAIDLNTARTALATNVDHHYMLRYGTLFASSFLTGYGQAVSQQGTNTTTDVFGNQHQTYPPLSPRDEVAVAIGQVGTTWGNQLGNIFNRPNTVTIDAGTSIGVLFMDDFILES
jgi:type IV secretory pathway VirB10-like protein